MKPYKTDRGFSGYGFTDYYDNECSIQDSSLATADAIWLGLDDADPLIMARDARAMGMDTKGQVNGWVPFPIPDEVSLKTRMHLTREQAAELIPILQHFVDNGFLPSPDTDGDDDLRDMISEVDKFVSERDVKTSERTNEQVPEDLLRRKNKAILLIQSDDDPDARSRYAREAASLESEVADFWLSMGDKNKAAVSLVSQASCLLDAGEIKAARDAIKRALDYGPPRLVDEIKRELLDTLTILTAMDNEE